METGARMEGNKVAYIRWDYSNVDDTTPNICPWLFRKHYTILQHLSNTGFPNFIRGSIIAIQCYIINLCPK